MFNRKARIKRRMLAQALKDVNTIRAEWMLPPIDALPEGTRSSSHYCVNANALRMGSDIAYVSVNADKIRYGLQPDDPWKSLTTTPAMRWLVKELDQGNLPELEEEDINVALGYGFMEYHVQPLSNRASAGPEYDPVERAVEAYDAVLAKLDPAHDRELDA